MQYLTLALTIALGTTLLHAENDGKLVIEIPSAVQAIIAREKGETGKIREFQRVNETDGTTYVIGLILDGKNYQLTLDAAGNVMRKEIEQDHSPKELSLEALPAKVRATLQREAGAGLLETIEMHTAKTIYTTETIIGKRRYRIEVDADGALVKKEYLGDEG